MDIGAQPGDNFIHKRLDGSAAKLMATAGALVSKVSNASIAPLDPLSWLDRSRSRWLALLKTLPTFRCFCGYTSFGFRRAAVTKFYVTLWGALKPRHIPGDTTLTGRIALGSTPHVLGNGLFVST